MHACQEHTDHSRADVSPPLVMDCKSSISTQLCVVGIGRDMAMPLILGPEMASYLAMTLPSLPPLMRSSSPRWRLADVPASSATVVSDRPAYFAAIWAFAAAACAWGALPACSSCKVRPCSGFSSNLPRLLR